MADAQDNTVLRTFKYRLLPSRKQHRVLADILESQRILYNAALQEREDCYRKTGKSRSYIQQFKALTELRRDPCFSRIPANIQRWTVKRCDEAYKSTFARIRNGIRFGFPRYKGKSRWRSFGFHEFSGIKLNRGRISFKGLPSSVRIHFHRPLPDTTILACCFTRGPEGWSVSLYVRIPARYLEKTGREIGVDIGLKELCFLSDGEAISNPRTAQKAERALRILSRALARCKRGSRRRMKAKLAVMRCHTNVRNTRHTYLHQVSAKMVRENDVIAVEKLNIKAMSQGILAKSIHDASWSKLKEMIAYKAEGAGRQFIEVDPRDTTQACSGCGTIVPKTLSDRWHCCPHCGLELDRDHNAAINILRRAVLRPGEHNVAEHRKRVARNLTSGCRL